MIMSAYDEKSALTLLMSVVPSLPEDAKIVVVSATYRITKNTVAKLAADTGNSFSLLREVDRIQATLNKRKINGVPISNIDKIRGLRPTLIVIVEPLMIPRDTIESLIQAMVAAQ